MLFFCVDHVTISIIRNQFASKHLLTLVCLGLNSFNSFSIILSFYFFYQFFHVIQDLVLLFFSLLSVSCFVLSLFDLSFFSPSLNNPLIFIPVVL